MSAQRPAIIVCLQPDTSVCVPSRVCNISRSFDRARVWQRYGWFTALMSAGCASGAVSHVLYSRWLAEYYFSDRAARAFCCHFAAFPACFLQSLL